MPHLEKYLQFRSCVSDLIDSDAVRKMNEYIQHSDVTTLEHCVYVAYISFLICRFFGFNSYAAARGGLLHDLFLYDWHYENPSNGPHGFTHPTTALKNANHYFELSEMEQDIIKKHMWPLTVKLPRYKESLVVCGADKFCAVAETLGFYRRTKMRRAIGVDLSRHIIAAERA